MKYYRIKETGRVRSEERLRIIFNNNGMPGTFDDYINKGLENNQIEEIPEKFIIKD